MIDAKIQPIRRELDIATQAWLGPAARADMLAIAARKILRDTDDRNTSAVAHSVSHRTFVDGVETEAIETVKADGVIVRTYDLMPLILGSIGDELWKHSPVLSGDYQRSHRLLADGIEIAVVRDGWTAPSLPAGARELVFVPTVEYARPIERGWSKKAPDGVYQVVAALGKRSFSKFAKIVFGYREVEGIEESKRERAARPHSPRDMRQPAIIIQPT